jgi:hypothetical protein
MLGALAGSQVMLMFLSEQARQALNSLNVVRMQHDCIAFRLFPITFETINFRRDLSSREFLFGFPTPLNGILLQNGQCSTLDLSYTPAHAAIAISDSTASHE